MLTVKRRDESLSDFLLSCVFYIMKKKVSAQRPIDPDLDQKLDYF